MKLPTGVHLRKNKTKTTVVISFMYRGEQCRETLSGLDGTAQKHIRDASNFRSEVLRKIEAGTFRYADYFPKSKKLKKFGKSNSQTTVKHYLNQYIEHAEQRGLSPSTINGYQKDKKALEHFHALMPKEITPHTIKTYIINSNHLSLKTVRNRLSLLKSALDEAVIDELIVTNPCTGISAAKYMGTKNKPVEDNEEHVDPFDPIEVEAILNAAKPAEKLIIQFWFETGLRSSELIALKWDNVDLFKKRILVKEAVVRKQTKGTKTGKVRFVELTEAACQVLQQQKERTFLHSKYVFHEPRQNTPLISADQLRKNIWVPSIKKSTVRYRNPYQCRHTFATKLISQGENLWWIAEQMGHTSPEMLYRHYGNYIKEYDTKSGSIQRVNQS